MDRSYPGKNRPQPISAANHDAAWVSLHSKKSCPVFVLAGSIKRRPRHVPPCPALLPPHFPASDAALFRRYHDAPDETKFRHLVDLHLPMVWSTARRLTHGDAALAEDIAQIVFADFARKAPALPPGTVAAGWLHRHTCFISSKMMRSEIRRRRREHTAAQLHLDEAMSTDPDTLWQEAAPHLDAALDQLPRPDREALLLRFWQQQDHRSIGTALGTSEDTARKRIARALEKLRTLLRRRGVLLTVAFLGQCLTHHANAAVPSTLAATLPGAAWRQANATKPITKPPTSLLRRFWPVAAAALLVTAALWSLVHADAFRRTPSTPPLASSGPSPTNHQTNTSAEIPLHFTLADLPAHYLSVRLLTWEPSEDDEALFNEVKQLATADGILLEFDLSASAGQKAKFAEAPDYKFPVGWKLDPVTDRPVSTEVETKNLGTTLEATPRWLSPGTASLEWTLTHFYADPEFHEWPLVMADKDTAPQRSIKMEDFFSCYARGQTADLKPGMPQLLMTKHLSSAVLPDTHPGPRTLLLFVTISPP